MCREYEHEYERIDLNSEQIDLNLDTIAESLFDEITIPDPEELNNEDAVNAIEPMTIETPRYPGVRAVNRNNGSRSTDKEVEPIAFRLPRLIVTLLIGFAVFSIECYLFDFPEFQSEINRHTQLLGGLTTAVGGVALLTRTNWK
jgi:hypothetical protein